MSLKPTEQAALQRAASLLRLTARAIGFRVDRLMHAQVQADATEALAMVRELVEPVLAVLERGGQPSIAAATRERLVACAQSVGAGEAPVAVADLQHTAWFVQAATSWSLDRAGP
jgi:hypothetical protein